MAICAAILWLYPYVLVYTAVPADNRTDQNGTKIERFYIVELPYAHRGEKNAVRFFN